MRNLNTIPLSALRTIETIGRTGSLGAAASELGVTPGALSQRLTKAEAALGRPLFLRQPEGLQPTEACREMVEQHFRPRFEYLQNLLDSWLPPGMPDYRRRQVAFSVVGQCVHYRMAGEVIAMLTPEEDRRQYHSLDQLAFHITTLTLASLQDRPIWELDTQLRELLEELAGTTSS